MIKANNHICSIIGKLHVYKVFCVCVVKTDAQSLWSKSINSRSFVSPNTSSSLVSLPVCLSLCSCVVSALSRCYKHSCMFPVWVRVPEGAQTRVMIQIYDRAVFSPKCHVHTWLAEVFLKYCSLLSQVFCNLNWLFGWKGFLFRIHFPTDLWESNGVKQWIIFKYSIKCHVSSLFCSCSGIKTIRSSSFIGNTFNINQCL